MDAQLQADYDVVVVGGGAAGLSGALALSRARRWVLVVDAGQPRNAPAHGVHNYLGREGTAPADLVALGRAEVEDYGGQVVDGRVISARALPGEPVRFRVELDDGRAVTARRLLVATGAVDALPDVPGVADLWGTDVLHCPYCHGWEVRDQSVGVLGSGPMSVHQALMWRQWSEDVTLFLSTAPEPTDEQWEQLAARGVAVVDGEVTGLEVTGGRLSGVRLAGGRVVPRRALVVATRVGARVPAGLGLETEDVAVGGHVMGTRVAAAPDGTTSVPGVRVVGNAGNPMAQVIASAAEGLTAAAALNGELIAEDTALAVARARSRGASLADVFSAASEAEVCARVLGGRRHGLLGAQR